LQCRVAMLDNIDPPRVGPKLNDEVHVPP
jgi:hypothetical protein